MRELILTTTALLMLAASAHATAWDIPDGQGGWKDNPECTGGCADLRDEGRKNDRPNGGPPQRIDGEKPAAKRDRERPDDKATGPRPQYWCIAPDGRLAAVNGMTGPRPKAAPRCGWHVHVKGGVLGQW